MEEKKRRFVEALSEAYGIIAEACDAVAIHRSTYYRWYSEDEEFRQKVDEVNEKQVDYVESKLLQNITAGDTSAIIFYLKTKGKHRGYSDKAQKSADAGGFVVSGGSGVSEVSRGAGGSCGDEHRRMVEKKVRSKKAYIVKLLKEQGKYTAELTYQVEITAKLLVRADLLSDEILSEGYRTVNVEYSREGNERITVNPKEKLYLDVLERGQKALRALGMNTESKERKSDNDTFSEFMEGLRE